MTKSAGLRQVPRGNANRATKALRRTGWNEHCLKCLATRTPQGIEPIRAAMVRERSWRAVLSCRYSLAGALELNAENASVNQVSSCFSLLKTSPESEFGNLA